MVSCSIYFDSDREGPQIEQMLAQFAPVIKSVSMLPLNTDAYEQMPYEEISLEKYQKLSREMPLIDWKAFTNSDGQEEIFCSNNTCELK